MKNAKQNIFQTLKIISLTLILTTGLSIALAWNGPAAAPPGDNTDEPLNTSNNWQTKYGYLSLPKLLDSNDGQTGYYLDPGANSWLYRLYSYDIRSSIFYDQDNTSYYVDPASTSRINKVLVSAGNKKFEVDGGSSIFINSNELNTKSGSLYLQHTSGASGDAGTSVIVGNDLTVGGSINLGGVNRSTWPVDTDTNTWRPAQTLSVSGQTLSISSGNSVTLPRGLSVVRYSGTGCGNCPCGTHGSKTKYCMESCSGRVCSLFKPGTSSATCYSNYQEYSWTMYCVE